MARRARAKPQKKPATRPAATAKRALHYKVVELSNVDEHSIERTLNEWVPQGWTFEGVQFAMRESSKRPSMAFVYFTREGAPLVERQAGPDDERYRDEEAAQAHLARMARADEVIAPATTTVHDAWERLKQLAGDGEEDA